LAFKFNLRRYNAVEEEVRQVREEMPPAPSASSACYAGAGKAVDDAAAAAAAGRGEGGAVAGTYTRHFSAQPEPFLTQNTP